MQTTDCESQRTVSFQGLLRAARAGDNAAREHLYVQYGPYFRRLVVKKLRTQRIEWSTTADDIFDTVVLRIWQEDALNLLDSEEDFLRYVSRAVEREVLDLRRKLTASCRDYRRLEALPDELVNLSPGDSDPVRKVSFQEQLDSVHSQLSLQNKQILDLLLAGKGWIFIGAELGIDSETLRKRFRRSLAELRQQLGD